MLYQYIKAAPRRKRAVHPLVVSWGLMTVGAMLILWTAWPILTFSLIQRYGFSRVTSPVGDGGLSASTISVLGTNIDYANPNVWFPASPQKKVVTPVNSYKLSIPKLKIKDATVIIAGDDLFKSLIHYGGTGLPGQYGTAVIFGHSTLPQLYNPTNYKTIFSLLPTLREGDEIFVDYDGVNYRYVIYEMTVTKPEDLSSLEQKFDDVYLTLVTCVPPGTYWERLNVKAKLEKI